MERGGAPTCPSTCFRVLEMLGRLVPPALKDCVIQPGRPGGNTRSLTRRDVGQAPRSLGFESEGKGCLENRGSPWDWGTRRREDPVGLQGRQELRAPPGGSPKQL